MRSFLFLFGLLSNVYLNPAAAHAEACRIDTLYPSNAPTQYYIYIGSTNVGAELSYYQMVQRVDSLNRHGQSNGPLIVQTLQSENEDVSKRSCVMEATGFPSQGETTYTVYSGSNVFATGIPFSEVEDAYLTMKRLGSCSGQLHVRGRYEGDGTTNKCTSQATWFPSNGPSLYTVYAGHHVFATQLPFEQIDYALDFADRSGACATP